MSYSDYVIVKAETVSALQREVTKHLKDGWELMGGVVLDGNSLLQTLAKYDEDGVDPAGIISNFADQLEEIKQAIEDLAETVKEGKPLQRSSIQTITKTT